MYSPPPHDLYITFACRLQGIVVLFFGIAAGFLFIAGTLNTIG